MNDVKRLFFGLEVACPWPSRWPNGRRIQEANRHQTVAFLGACNLPALLHRIKEIPLPPFSVGPTGIFDKCLFFPAKAPRCVAWHIDWLHSSMAMKEYSHALHHWHEIEAPRHEFCPHVTVCRTPFEQQEWRQAFSPSALYGTSLHLYESLGHSHYQSHWKHSFIEPFVEIEHTADMAFLCRGTCLQELLVNAQIALAFRFSELLPLCRFDTNVHTLDEVVVCLNQLITRADIEIGSPLKAVSYAGSVREIGPNLLEWEMIVDV